MIKGEDVRDRRVLRAILALLEGFEKDAQDESRFADARRFDLGTAAQLLAGELRACIEALLFEPEGHSAGCDAVQFDERSGAQ